MNRYETLNQGDYRRGLMAELPTPEFLNFAENRAAFERENCAQMMNLTLYPNGYIEATPTGLFLPGKGENRKAYEDESNLSLNNPFAFEQNMKFSKAVDRLMREGESGLTEPISIEFGRVAIGSLYQFLRDGKTFDIVRFNNNPNDTFCNYAVPNSGLFKTSHAKNHPGDMIAASMSELIPCAINESTNTISPYNPFANMDAPLKDKRDYKNKSRLIRGELAERLAEVHGTEMGQKALLASDHQYRPMRGRTDSPIQFGFKNPNGSVDTLRGLNAYFTKAGALELSMPITLEIQESAFALDPDYSSHYAFVENESLREHAINTDAKNNENDYPRLNNITLFDGATGMPINDGFMGYDENSHTMGNFRISPCLRAAVGNLGE